MDQAESIMRFTGWRAATLAIILALPAAASGQTLQDRGIGGTGVVPEALEGDRGIGGTGMIGTIRSFGSIVVNNIHVNYAPDVPVRVDGEPGRVSDLKIGHVVRVVAEIRNGRPATGRIDVASEVVGPIESVSGKTLSVLGQKVSIENIDGTGSWRSGERVAVFGLRRPDGVIVASLIERRTGGPDRVAGRIVRLRNGSLGIGRLKLTGVDPALAGARVVLEGVSKAGVLPVAKAVQERDLLKPGLRRFSIEAYVERTRTGLRLGGGVDVAGKVSGSLPTGTYALAVVTAIADPKNRLEIENVSFEGPPVRSGKSRQSRDAVRSRDASAGTSTPTIDPVPPVSSIVDAVRGLFNSPNPNSRSGNDDGDLDRAGSNIGGMNDVGTGSAKPSRSKGGGKSGGNDGGDGGNGGNGGNGGGGCDCDG